MTGAGEGAETPIPVDAVAALAYGWRTFRANASALHAAVLVPVVLELACAIGSRIVLHSVAKWFLFQIVTIVVGAVASVGLTRLALALTPAAGEPDAMRAPAPEVRGPAWIAFAVLFGLCEGVGLVLCVIPGVLFLAYFGLAPYFFLDRGLGARAALRASRAAVTGNGLGFVVLTAIVVGVLGIVLFGVGILVTQSVAALALAFVYRHVTNGTATESAGGTVAA